MQKLKQKLTGSILQQHLQQGGMGASMRRRGRAGRGRATGVDERENRRGVGGGEL